ncbi:MAG: hypothetical protein ACLSAF_06360 [Intestinimonas sp.]
MTKQEAAQAYLRRDPVLYANLLEALRRGAPSCWRPGRGRPPLRAGMRGVHDVRSLPGGGRAAAGNGLGGLRPFVGHELAYFEQAKARWGFPLSQIRYSAAYLGTERCPCPPLTGRCVPWTGPGPPGFSGTTATPLGACPIWRRP